MLCLLHATSQSVIVILWRWWLNASWLWSLQLSCWLSSSHSKSERNHDLVWRGAVIRLGTSTKCNPRSCDGTWFPEDGWCGKVWFFPSWEFTRRPCSSLCSLMMLLSLTLRYGCHSCWGPVACCFRSVVRRDDPSCLEAIVVGCLNLKSSLRLLNNIWTYVYLLFWCDGGLLHRFSITMSVNLCI